MSHCHGDPALTLLPFLCHQIIENCPVTGIQVRADDFGVKRVYAVETAHGTIQTPCVVNCAGMGHRAWQKRGVALHQSLSHPSGCHPLTTAGLLGIRRAQGGCSLHRCVGASAGPAGRGAGAAGSDASCLRGDRAHRGHPGQSVWLQILCSGGF